jgi:hypothetical protein
MWVCAFVLVAMWSLSMTLYRMRRGHRGKAEGFDRKWVIGTFRHQITVSDGRSLTTSTSFDATPVGKHVERWSSSTDRLVAKDQEPLSHGLTVINERPIWRANRWVEHARSQSLKKEEEVGRQVTSARFTFSSDLIIIGFVRRNSITCMHLTLPLLALFEPLNRKK